MFVISINNFEIIIDPILNDSLVDMDTAVFFIEDPYAITVEFLLN